MSCLFASVCGMILRNTQLLSSQVALFGHKTGNFHERLLLASPILPGVGRWENRKAAEDFPSITDPLCIITIETLLWPQPF
jgi:hypothetical protein